MQAIQLELDLWNNLEAAAAQPLAANMNELWQELSDAIAPLPQQLQLAVAAEAILQITLIHSKRAIALLDDWGKAPDYYSEPVLDEDALSGMLRQTMTLDLDALLEPSPYYPRQSSRYGTQSVAPYVDRATMQKVLDQIASTESNFEEEITQLAHIEDISAWTKAITSYFTSKQAQCLPLVELVDKVQYPTGKQPDIGSRLVKTWIALLLGEFQLEQQDFYELEGILVSVLI